MTDGRFDVPPPRPADSPHRPGPPAEPGWHTEPERGSVAAGAYYGNAPAPAGERPGRTGCGTIIGAAVLAFIVASFVGLAAGFLGARLATDTDLIGQGETPARMTSVRVIPSETEEPVVAAAAAALPAVVNIEVRGSGGGDQGELPEDHPGVPTLGNGSGVGYRVENGTTLILTNNHVVEGADSLLVRDSRGRSLTATVVGRDAETDIAVVRVKGRLPVVQTGDSSKLIVGQTVVAIGSPFGLEHSVTSGVVSALGRSLPDFGGAQQDAYPLVDVIQTDAAINPGNSGGALVDREGKLVGVNTAIYTTTNASGGIGFAVPVNTVIRVADQLIAGKAVTHPFLGISGRTVTRELARSENLSVTEGALVIEITRGSGAATADIRPRDVVTAVDGDPVRSMDDLILLVRRKQVGDTVTLSIVRGTDRREVDVTVGDKPSDVGTSGQSRPSTETTR